MNASTVERARLRLDANLAEVSGAVPCRTSDSGLWTHDKAEEREAATYRCRACPVLEVCGQYADVADERFGVWAGIDRTERPKSTRGRA